VPASTSQQQSFRREDTKLVSELIPCADRITDRPCGFSSGSITDIARRSRRELSDDPRRRPGQRARPASRRHRLGPADGAEGDPGRQGGVLRYGAKLPVRLRVLLPLVENAVSGNAMRPLDIVRIDRERRDGVEPAELPRPPRGRPKPPRCAPSTPTSPKGLVELGASLTTSGGHRSSRTPLRSIPERDRRGVLARSACGRTDRGVVRADCRLCPRAAG
jgi:hypothetical protein